jgi:hypothetical protein
MKGIKILQQKLRNCLMSFLQDITKGFRIGIGIVLALTTAGIFAVAVSGTFNTFSSGSVMKSADINANFASLKTAIEGIPTQKAMRLIYETDVTSATTSVNITGLDGNSDVTYEIVYRIISNGGTGANDYFLRLNNDSGNNYTYTQIVSHQGLSTTVNQSGNATWNRLPLSSTAGGSSSGSVHLGKSLLYAKSGYTRSLIDTSARQQASGQYFTQVGYSTWTDTGQNITSIQFSSTESNTIGAGSRIEVWARR